MKTKEIKDIRFVFRIAPELHKQLVGLAKKENRSLNNQLSVMCLAWFDAQLLRRRLEELEQRGN